MILDGIGELDFIDNPNCEIMCKLDNGTKGIGELNDFDNPSIDIVYELDNGTSFRANVAATPPSDTDAIFRCTSGKCQHCATIILF